MVIPQDPLTADEREKIAQALAAHEARSRAELAVAIMPVCDHYRLYPGFWGGFLAVIALGIAALIRPDLPIARGFLGTALVFIAVTAALQWLPLRLLFVPKRVKHRRASQLAHREFAARILASAERRTGVLIFVALGEHYIEILTSRDVDAVVPQEIWNKIVADFVAAVKAERLAAGLAEAVGAGAAVLAAHFPRAAGAKGPSPKP